MRFKAYGQKILRINIGNEKSGKVSFSLFFLS